MIAQKPFAKMRGMEVMTFVRDELLEEAARKRSFIADCEKVAGGVTPPEDRQRVRALEAAGDAMTWIIAVGLEERAKCDRDPSRPFPDWIWRLSSQMRTALVEETPDTEDLPTG